MLGDLRGQASKFILLSSSASCDSGVHSWERSGWIHTFCQHIVGAGGTQGGCPGYSAWPRNSSANVSIWLDYCPGQLTTQAGRTPCHVLLISFSIKYCTHMVLYILYIHSVLKVQSSSVLISQRSPTRFCQKTFSSVHSHERNKNQDWKRREKRAQNSFCQIPISHWNHRVVCQSDLNALTLWMDDATGIIPPCFRYLNRVHKQRCHS